jgi:hypothetical protein
MAGRVVRDAIRQKVLEHLYEMVMVYRHVGQRLDLDLCPVFPDECIEVCYGFAHGSGGIGERHLCGTHIGGACVYRACYAMLLRLYPRLFLDRFGEGMAQTFHDLCRERRNAGRRLFGFALWVFLETSLGIVRENITHMTRTQKTVLRVALAALGLLMVPLVASRVVEGWNWGPGAFVFTYALFFGTGMAYALVARQQPAVEEPHSASAAPASTRECVPGGLTYLRRPGAAQTASRNYQRASAVDLPSKDPRQALAS